jgi:uncharacterized protein (DUF2141 family)
MINLLSLLITALFLYQPAASITGTQILKVEVSGYSDTPGTQIYVSVFIEDGFLKKSIQTKSITLSDNKTIVEFDLPVGEYAVSTYHDLNNNKELDRYFFGKPKEPYGFSNNVRSLGPPSFESCKFSIQNEVKSINIKLMD